MKHYLKWPGNNFGDKLNDIIFPQLGIDSCIPYTKPNLVNVPKNTMLGLGTLLSQKVASNVTVLGSGSDGSRKPKIKLDYRFVRGKLTANFLNLDSKLAVGDTAYFLKDYIQNLSTTKEYNIGIIPHHSNDKITSGHNVISPTLPIDQFIAETSKYKIILAEAMHGAICADILRIPWSPISINSDRYPMQKFKWQDWASMFDINLTFGNLKSYTTYLSSDKNLNSVSNNVRQLMISATS